MCPHDETALFCSQCCNCPLWLGKELMLDDKRQYDRQYCVCGFFICPKKPCVKAFCVIFRWNQNCYPVWSDGPSQDSNCPVKNRQGHIFLCCFTTPLFMPPCTPKSTVCCIVLALTWPQHWLVWLRLTIILLWFFKPVHPFSISSCSPPETCTSDWSKNHKVNTL